jgi:Transposase DDE domain group 1
VQSSHTFSSESAVFDERNLVSAAGLVPVLELAEQTGLSRLIGEYVDLPSTRVASGAVNAAGKLTSIIGGMMCGADSIDDVNVLRAGGTPRVFDEVYAPSTLGIFLREFTFGHSNQLAAVAREHLVALAARTALLPGSEQRVFLDIDSLLRPVYGHHKQGASFGHAKIASRALLRLGLSPQITTLSTATAPPVIAEAQLRSGKAGSGRGAAAQIKRAITTARACEPTTTIMLRGDSAFGTKKVIATCVAEGVEFSLSVSRNKRLIAALEGIDEAAYTPVHYPGAVADPDTGALISDAEVAETRYTLRLARGRTLTMRLVVRRVKDARYPDALFPVWRYHPFVTNSALPTAEADITHRRHAIIETTFADLIDGPLAHIPSGLFAANCAWLACAVITHNLLRAAATIAGGATLRRDLVNVPARFAAPARKPMLHLPAHWPSQIRWKTLWDNIISYSPAIPRAG